MKRTMMIAALMTLPIGLSGCDKKPEAPKIAPSKPFIAPYVAAKDGLDKASKRQDVIDAQTVVKNAEAAYRSATGKKARDESRAKYDASVAALGTLLQPENKGTLTAVLTYHVVAGRITSGQLIKLINAGRGKAVITTVSGQKLTAKKMGKNIVLVDAKGRVATVTTANVMQSNGIIHVINRVLLP